MEDCEVQHCVWNEKEDSGDSRRKIHDAPASTLQPRASHPYPLEPMLSITLE